MRAGRAATACRPGRRLVRPVSVGTAVLARTTDRTGPAERRSPVVPRVLLVIVRNPSLPRRQVRLWAISAGIVMVRCARIAGAVFARWGGVGYLLPGIDDPYPTPARRVPVLVAGTPSRIGRRV